MSASNARSTSPRTRFASSSSTPPRAATLGLPRAARRPRSLSRRRGGLVRKQEGGEMKSKWVWPLLVVACSLALATTAAAARESAPADGDAGSAPVAPQMALDWNSYAVDAVRAARTMDGVPPGGAPRALYQAEG